MLNPAAVSVIAKSVGLTVWPAFLARACVEVAEVFLGGGWRGSKTFTAIFFALLKIILVWMMVPQNRLIWLVGPDYEQAREEYFNLTAWLSHLGLQMEASAAMQGPLTAIVQLRGGGVLTIATKSAENPTTLGSVAPDLIIACEAGQISEEGRDRIRGRTSTKNAPIVWAGTFENDKGRAQYAWFEEESQKYTDHPTPRRVTFSLPIYENIALFGSCLDGDNGILNDPTLAAFCPDDNHGEAHSGIDPDHPQKIPTTAGVPLHPKVRELYEECRDKPKFWLKFYEGKPVGVPNPVYEFLEHDKWDDFTNNKYLLSMSEVQRRLGIPFRWIRSAGGTDFGTVHPSALTVGSMNTLGDTWVRHSVRNDSGAMQWVWAQQKTLSRAFHIPKNMWGLDPMAGKYADEFTPGTTISGGLFSREARVGIVQGVAKSPIDAAQHLYFDGDDPGVVLLFREMQRVHRKKNANGQVAYVREEDDMTASFEDMMAMLHGTPILKVSNRWQLQPLAPLEPSRPYRSVS